DVNNKCLPIREVAANFQLAASTVQSIVDVFDRENQIAPKPRDLKQKLVDQFPNIQICERTVARYVTNLGFTLKRLTVVPEGRNTPETIQKRKDYVQKIYNENINIYSDIVYIDETGFNLHLSKSRGHAHRGQPAIRKVESNRGKNISVIAAINENGVLYHKSILGSVNSEIYATFIYELINIIPN
ncbi:21791_t:CDS:2, partial [Racocetra persica]